MSTSDAAGPDHRSDRARTSSPGEELTVDSTEREGRGTRVRARSERQLLERYYSDPWPAERFAEHLTRAGVVVELAPAELPEWREVQS